MNDQTTILIDVDSLRTGGASRFEVVDENDVLLLGPGCVLTDTHIRQLQDRGVKQVRMHPSDVKALSDSEDGSAVRKNSRYESEQPIAISERRQERSGEAFDQKRRARFTEKLANVAQSIEQIGNGLTENSLSQLKNLVEIPGELLSIVLEDADQAIFRCLEQSANDSLAVRCTQLCLLATNTAIEMELEDDEILHVGIAGLFHDIGLYMLPENFRNPTGVLSQSDIWDYRRHPTLIANALGTVPDIPTDIAHLVHQVHERFDGSGYPRGLHRHLIHPLARILNVVDTYIALTNEGAGRPAVIPHDAIGFLLVQGARGHFDATVLRSFLNQITLFPIGSRVTLSNGENATVIRRDGRNYANPVVLLDATGDSATNEPEQISDILDQRILTINDSELKIANAIKSTGAKQMRMTPDMSQALDLSMMEATG